MCKDAKLWICNEWNTIVQKRENKCANMERRNILRVYKKCIHMYILVNGVKTTVWYCTYFAYSFTFQGIIENFSILYICIVYRRVQSMNFSLDPYFQLYDLFEPSYLFVANQQTIFVLRPIFYCWFCYMTKI